MEPATEHSPSFWATLPGIVTAIAALMTASGGLIGLIAHEVDTDAHASSSTTTTSSTVAGPSTTQGPTFAPPTSAGRSGGGAHGGGGGNGGTNTTTTSPSPTTTQRTTTTTTAPQSRIEATLRADPFSGGTSCPVTIAFSGRISMIHGSGTVSYRFVRSDGATGPVETVTFTAPGSKEVSSTWSRGGPGERLVGWEQLVILSPVATESNRATFDLTCRTANR